MNRRLRRNVKHTCGLDGEPAQPRNADDLDRENGKIIKAVDQSQEIRVKQLPPTIRIDLAGQTFGKLHVVGFGGYRGKSPMWVCRCECGSLAMYYRTNLRSGTSTQCMVCCRISHKERSTTHSLWRTPVYRTWERVRRNDHVCKRWNDFQKFYEDVGEKPGKDYCLVRIKPASGWRPDNVHWVPRHKAQTNRGKRNLIKFNGQTKCITEWAREVGITPQSLRGRLKSGWTIKEALQKKTQ